MSIVIFYKLIIINKTKTAILFGKWRFFDKNCDYQPFQLW